MTTQRQKSFKASVREMRAIGLQVNLKQAIKSGAVTQDMDIKELARRYEMSQAKVRRLLSEVIS